MRKEMESQNRGLYRESFEHDNCGIGAIVNIKGKKTHSTVAGCLEYCRTILSTEPERMQKERQEMAWVF